MDLESSEYKLRAGPPMPVGDDKNILQTFGVNKYRIVIQTVTKDIVDSSRFRGNGGDLVSASYNRLLDKSGLKFSARLVYSPSFEDEGVLE